MKGQRIPIYKILIVTGLLAVTCIALYGFMYVDIHIKNRQIAVLANDIENFRTHEQEFRTIEGVLEDTRLEREDLLTFFVGSGEVVTFIEFMEHLASSNALRPHIESVTVMEGDEKNRSKTYTEVLELRMSTRGSWDNTIHFLNLIEIMPIKANIVTVDIQEVFEECELCVSGEDVWEGRFTFEILKIR